MPDSHILHRKKLEAKGTRFIKDQHRVVAELTPELCSPCPLMTVGRLLLIHRLLSSASDRTAASQQMTKINEQFISGNKTHWTFNYGDPGLFVSSSQRHWRGESCTLGNPGTAATLSTPQLCCRCPASSVTVNGLQPYNTNSATTAYIPTLPRKQPLTHVAF